MNQCQADNKKLRQLLNEDHSAVNSYLGIVLGKQKVDLDQAEKKQVLTLMKDDGDGQAQSTMAAWDTILSLKKQLTKERELITNLYEVLTNDKCTCKKSNAHIILKRIQSFIEIQDGESLNSHQRQTEAFELISYGLSSSKFNNNKSHSQSARSMQVVK